MVTLVYAYGCGQPTAGREHAQAEYERCATMWDELVAVDRWFDDTVAAQARDDVREIATLEQDMEIARGCARATDDEDVQREYWGKFRDAKRARLKLLIEWQRAHKPRMISLNELRFERVKKVRQDSGLWWCNYNRVVRSYQVGRTVAHKRGARLRAFDPERDDGVLEVQIIRTRTGLGAAPSELHGKVAPLHVEPIDPSVYTAKISRGERSRLTRSILSMRVDLDDNRISLPVYWHRPIPEGARVKVAQLTWRRVGSEVRWRLLLTLDIPTQPIEPPAYRRRGEVSFCWEQTEGGGLGVAQVSALGVVDQERNLVLLPSWVQRMQRVRDLQREIDKRLERARLELGVPENMGIRQLFEHLRMSAHRQTAEVLEWRRETKRLWEERAHLWDKLLRQRREYYRIWARVIVREYPHLVLHEQDLERLARTERNTPENARRHLAAVHYLRQELLHQARKIGATIEDEAGKILVGPDLEKTDGAWKRRKARRAGRVATHGAP